MYILTDWILVFVWLNQYCWLRKDFHIGVCSLGKSQHNWSEIHTWNDSSAMQARRNRGAGRARAPPQFLADQLSLSQQGGGGQVMPTTLPRIFRPPDKHAMPWLAKLRVQRAAALPPHPSPDFDSFRSKTFIEPTRFLVLPPALHATMVKRL